MTDETSGSVRPDFDPPTVVSGDPGPVVMSDDRVFLAPMLPADHQFLYWLATVDDIAYRWRFHGVIPPFELFVQQLNANVFVQFVVRTKADNQPVGHVLGYAGDLRNGHVFVANITHPEMIGQGVGTEAQVLFINYLFDLWAFRKIYVEIPEFTYVGIRHWVGDDLFRIEGRMRAHSYYKNRYWDQYLLAAYRDDWALYLQNRPQVGA